MLCNLCCLKTRLRLLCNKYQWHSSLNLASQQLKLCNIFIFGMAYFRASRTFLKSYGISQFCWTGLLLLRMRKKDLCWFSWKLLQRLFYCFPAPWLAKVESPQKSNGMWFFGHFFAPYLFHRSRNNRRDKLRSKFWREKMFRKPHLKLLRWCSVRGTNKSCSVEWFPYNHNVSVNSKRYHLPLPPPPPQGNAFDQNFCPGDRDFTRAGYLT